MSDAAIPRRKTAGLKVMFKLARIPDDPDPPRLIGWEVSGVRFWLFGWDIISVELGVVSAATRAEAMSRAKERWPNERRLRVEPA